MQPAIDEAGLDGFGKESLLRALVVLLSRTIEDLHGPPPRPRPRRWAPTWAARWRSSFPVSQQITGRWSPEQLARCFVRLHAVDGHFRGVEVSTERIVLENTRGPLGDTAIRAPALCRMASSVFGGVAARRSASGASVRLEERIAMGHPGCGVVVHLGPAPAEVEPFVNRCFSPRSSAHA